VHRHSAGIRILSPTHVVRGKRWAVIDEGRAPPYPAPAPSNPIRLSRACCWFALCYLPPGLVSVWSLPSFGLPGAAGPSVRTVALRQITLLPFGAHFMKSCFSSLETYFLEVRGVCRAGWPWTWPSFVVMFFSLVLRATRV